MLDTPFGIGSGEKFSNLIDKDSGKWETVPMFALVVALLSLFLLGCWLLIDRVLGHVYWPDRRSAVDDFRDEISAIREVVQVAPANTGDRVRTFGQIKKSRRV